MSKRAGNRGSRPLHFEEICVIIYFEILATIPP